MIPQVVVLILVAFSANLAEAQTCQTLYGYNLENLTTPSYWVMEQNNNICIDTSVQTCFFYMSFCQQLPIDFDTGCLNSSICQNEADSLVELGRFNSAPFVPRPSQNGFYAYFDNFLTTAPKMAALLPAVETCKNISVTFQFDCNEMKPWPILSPTEPAAAPPPKSVSKIFNANYCEYIFVFDYAGACYTGTTKTVTTTTPTTGPNPTTTTTEYNPPPAKICVQPAHYDIDVLTNPPYWTFNINDDCSLENNSTDPCTLYMAFCKDIVDLIDCKNSSACVRYPNRPGSSIIVGNYTVDPFDEFEKDGFEATYMPGQTIINKYTGLPCPVSISMKFQCDPSAAWTIPPENTPGLGPEPLLYVPISADSCQIKVTVPYDGACSVKPSGGGGGLSAGSILLIIFFISVTLYLLIGISLNKVVNQKQGVELIPHFEFWSSVMLFAMDGFFFVWRFITCQQSKEKNLSYDQI